MIRATLLFVAIVATCVAGASAAGGAGKVIGHGVRLKSTKVWYAQGNATAPKTLSARVDPVPAQPVKVQWSVVCQKPNRLDPAYHLGTNVKSGQTSLRAAGTVRLGLPYAKPPACVATVYATLAREGMVTLRLLQT